MYWTDAAWRGRWNQLHDAGSRVESMWENGKAITNAAVVGGVQFVLLSTGKVDAFTYANYAKEGGPSTELSLTIELPNDEVSGGKWELLVPDASRESVWAGNDEGVLAEVSAGNKGLRLDSVIKLKSGSFKFATGGVMLGDTLMLLDSANPIENRVVFANLASNCALGADVTCKCRPNGEAKGRLTCSVTGTEISGTLRIPPLVTVAFAGDLSVQSGALVTMALSSRVVAEGSISIERGAKLVLSDPRRRVPAGKHELFRGSSVKGAFESAEMDRGMVLGRLFFCFQLASLRLLVGSDKVTVHLSVTGQYCVSPVLTMPILFGACGMLLFWVLFGCGSGRPAKNVGKTS